MSTPRHVYTTVGGYRLHHLEYGGEGRPILLIHGVLGNAWMWDGVAPQLTGQGQVVAVDLRGYGDSQWSRDGADPTRDLAKDLAVLADIHHWSAASTVGFSLGGLVGLALWELRPDLVARLVMVDLPPSSTRAEEDVPPIQMSVTTHVEARRAERAMLPHAPDQLVEVMANHGYRPGPNGALVRKHHPAVAQRWRFRSEDWWATLSRFDQPMLFVHAPQGGVCSAEDAEKAAAAPVDGRLVCVPDSSHLIPLEQPGAFSSHIVDFLAGME